MTTVTSMQITVRLSVQNRADGCEGWQTVELSAEIQIEDGNWREHARRTLERLDEEARRYLARTAASDGQRGPAATSASDGASDGQRGPAATSASDGASDGQRGPAATSTSDGASDGQRGPAATSASDGASGDQRGPAATSASDGNGSPNGNGKKKDFVTAFWKAVYSAGMGRDDGLSILEQARGDFALALAMLEEGNGAK